MKFFKKLKRSVKAIKVVLIILSALAAVAGVVTVVVLWKKKKDAEKLESETIDNLIDEQLDDVDVVFEGEAIEE